MDLNRTQLDRFVRAVHRRLVVMRILERIGIGILIASIAGAILVPILMWRGQSALTLAMATLAIGAAAGFVWGATRRPSVLQSAMETDRQLGWSDLLGTAITVHDDEADEADEADGWARSVRAVA